MRRRMRVESVERQLPEGFTLPAAFGEFVAVAAQSDPGATGWFEVGTARALPRELTKKQRKSLVPFLKLGDGGVAAFWLDRGSEREPTPKDAPVVYLGAEGEARVVAPTIASFCAAVRERSTGIPDIDEAREALALGKRTRVVAPGDALVKRFDAWLAEGAPEAARGAEPEALRARLFAAAKAMLRDGRFRVYTARSAHWAVSFALERVRGRWSYLDFGAWAEVPAEYEFAGLTEVFLRCVKNPRRERYGVTVTREGIVSVERDTELLLLPNAMGGEQR